MFKQIVAIFIVCSVAVQSASAIKCIQCKSLTDPNCAKEPLEDNDIYKVDCSLVRKPNVMEELLPVTKCNKVITKDKAGLIVSRDCHFEVIGQKPDECTVSHSRQVESCYTCTGDYCNASAAASTSVGMMTVGSVALLAMAAITNFL